MNELPLPALALRMWREREALFPGFVQRAQPDRLDLHCGAWLKALEEAKAAGGLMRGRPGEFRLERLWFTPELCERSPGALFAFGDNLERKGSGPKSGQAIIRHELNAVGIVVKRAPSNRPGSFFSDADLELFKAENAAAFALLAHQLACGGTVVWAADGIETGRAGLRENAPRLAASLERARQRLEARAAPP